MFSFLQQKSYAYSQLPAPSTTPPMPSRRRTALYLFRVLFISAVCISTLAYLFPPSYFTYFHPPPPPLPSSTLPGFSYNFDTPFDNEKPGSAACVPTRGLVTTVDEDGVKWISPSLPLPLDATLTQRIAAWRAAPRASHEAWSTFGNQTCGSSRVVENINQLHMRNNIDRWNEVDKEKAHAVREELIKLLFDAEQSGGLKANESWTDRGVVFTAGNGDTFERVIVTLRLLRGYGTKLPAEIWHFPGEQPSSAQEFEYEKLGAVSREVEGLEKDAQPNRSKAFHIKGAALLQSSFREFIYLDSDSLPTKDITPLFDSPAYKELGAMFWPDFWKDPAENAIWSILGVQCRDEWTQEAGQVLIDKSKHLDVLHLVSHMLSVSQYQFFFTLSDGDKDLFRYAFLALRKRWAVPGRHLASASWKNDNAISTNRFCGHTMMQFDAEGLPAFVHQNLIKMLLGRFENGTTWGRTHQLRLPSDDLPSSNLSSLSFPTSADHLANVDSTGSGILSSPSLAVRARALAETGLRPFFHDGHRGSFYTLCVDSEYQLPPRGVTSEGEECKGTEVDKLLEETEVKMEMRMWEDDEILKGFESRFYEKHGVANGPGF